MNHSVRSCRSASASPVVRQRSRKFVQQPMATCWQASTRPPPTGSSNEAARPPHRLRDSSTVTATPRSTSAAAAARPARPPPMIATRGTEDAACTGMAWLMVAAPRSHRQASDTRSTARRRLHAACEDRSARLPHDLEQRAIGTVHGTKHDSPVGREQRIESSRVAETGSRALDVQPGKPGEPGRSRRCEIGVLQPEARKSSRGEIDAGPDQDPRECRGGCS